MLPPTLITINLVWDLVYLKVLKQISTSTLEVSSSTSIPAEIRKYLSKVQVLLKST